MRATEIMRATAKSPRLVKAVDSTTWAIDRVLGKKARGRGRVEEYLVKWKGFGPEYNRWILNYLINTLKITFLT